MLIDKGFTSGDVVTIKLVNGDELIARYEDRAPNGIKINKPMAVTVGARGLGLIPWLFFAEGDTFVLEKDHYFVVVQSKKEAADQYLQGTTGIALS